MSDTKPILQPVPDLEPSAPRPIALLCAPFRNRTLEDTTNLLMAKVHLLNLGWCPVFLPDTLVDCLDDLYPQERQIALECSRSFVAALANIPSARIFVVVERDGGGLSEGMKLDLAVWLENRPLPAAGCGFEEAPGYRVVTFTDKDAPR